MQLFLNSWLAPEAGSSPERLSWESKRGGGCWRGRGEIIYFGNNAFPHRFLNNVFNQTFTFRREFPHAYNDDDPSTNANGVRRRRVLVVGAGVAGVATAFALAKRGFSVAVVEAADRPGEECRSGSFCCRCCPFMFVQLL